MTMVRITTGKIDDNVTPSKGQGHEGEEGDEDDKNNDNHDGNDKYLDGKDYFNDYFVVFDEASNLDTIPAKSCSHSGWLGFL